jgi:hypothetical protein
MTTLSVVPNEGAPIDAHTAGRIHVGEKRLPVGRSGDSGLVSCAPLARDAAFGRAG